MSANETQVALVTGAGRGIGQALAVGFAEAGYDVVAVDLESKKDALQETKYKIESAGRQGYVYTLDVSSVSQIKDVVSQVLEKVGRVDVLINNAGILKLVSLQEIDESTWDAHFNVNVKGVQFMCQAIVPHMKERGAGRIINIASIAGRLGVPDQGHYAATKAAVISLTRVLSREVGQYGITVNAICPGIILTEMGKSNLGSDEAIRHWETVAALRRLGEPADVVGPAIFFASNQSSFVTGQALNVCGGIYFH